MLAKKDSHNDMVPDIMTDIVDADCMQTGCFLYCLVLFMHIGDRRIGLVLTGFVCLLAKQHTTFM